MTKTHEDMVSSALDPFLHMTCDLNEHRIQMSTHGAKKDTGEYKYTGSKETKYYLIYSQNCSILILRYYDITENTIPVRLVI